MGRKSILYHKFPASVLAFLLWAFSLCVPVRADGEVFTYPMPSGIHAEAAVLIEAETGQILYGRSENKRMEPASLTKIMTCLLSAELWDGGEEDTVEVTSEILADIDSESSSIDMVEGEILTVPDLFYSLMLPSANDAANALAVHFSGNVESFVEDMNARAGELGLSGTHFVNPHGLPAIGHYSTAYDLAQLTRAAIQNESFLRFAGAAEYNIPATSESEERELEHTNRMLCPDHEFYYPDAFAGKTGWTRAAGHCLMTAAERDGLTLICVVLRAGSIANEYEDTAALLDYGFENFKRVNIDCSPYDNTQVTFQGEDGEEHTAILSLRERKFSAVVPKGIQGDLIVFGFPEIVNASDGDIADALLCWSDQVAGAPSQVIRKVEVRVWMKEEKAVSVPVEQDVYVSEQPEEPKKSGVSPVVLGGIGGALVVSSLISWVRRKRR